MGFHSRHSLVFRGDLTAAQVVFAPSVLSTLSYMDITKSITSFSAFWLVVGWGSMKRNAGKLSKYKTKLSKL